MAWRFVAHLSITEINLVTDTYSVALAISFNHRLRNEYKFGSKGMSRKCSSAAISWFHHYEKAYILAAEYGDHRKITDIRSWKRPHYVIKVPLSCSSSGTS
jgi:hypothetical protein